ncbi:MAG: hypothetical protein LBP32_04335 [Spirochaetaceae bacterium]|nr:hypothetical protein [Spirochaetaceae bacterium]
MFFSCGIEDYLFLYPVPMGNITLDSNTRVTIKLPVIGEYYFTNFAVYYRIYISDISLTSISEAQYSDINPTLYSDYAVFKQYTDNDDQVPTSIGSLFTNRNYYALELRDAAIEDALSSSAEGKTIVLDFAPGSIPMLRIGDTAAYTLCRSNGNGQFSPVPSDRYFVNTSDLNSTANAVPTINGDVANKSNISGNRYAYVSMYIVVTGIDNNYSPIYSIPTFIGVLRLPD